MKKRQDKTAADVDRIRFLVMAFVHLIQKRNEKFLKKVVINKSLCYNVTVKYCILCKYPLQPSAKAASQAHADAKYKTVFRIIPFRRMKRKRRGGEQHVPSSDN